VTEQTPDHSTISRTRRLLPVETHKAVFRWFVKVLGEEGLIEGQTIAIDATTLEANAAMRSIRRRDDQRRYEEYLKDLAKAEGLRIRRGNVWRGWTASARRKPRIRTG